MSASARKLAHESAQSVPPTAPPSYSTVALSRAKEARAKLKTYAEREQIDTKFTDLFQRKISSAGTDTAQERPAIEEVRSLLEQGADVDFLATSSTGAKRRFTALTEACRLEGSDELVSLLLLMNASPDLKWRDEDDRQITALYMATLYNRLDNMTLLLDAGADIDLQCGDCGSVLSTACVMDHRAAIDLLLDRGADVNRQNGRYGSALAVTSNLGLKRVVEHLLERGADVNLECGGKYGNALHAAIEANKWEVVDILLESGAVASNASDRIKLATKSWRR